MSQQLGQLGSISSQIGDLTGAVQTMAGKKGGKSGEGEGGPANTDDCPPGSQCVETKTGSVFQSFQKIFFVSLVLLFCLCFCVSVSLYFSLYSVLVFYTCVLQLIMNTLLGYYVF